MARFETIFLTAVLLACLVFSSEARINHRPDEQRLKQWFADDLYMLISEVSTVLRGGYGSLSHMSQKKMNHWFREEVYNLISKTSWAKAGRYPEDQSSIDDPPVNDHIPPCKPWAPEYPCRDSYMMSLSDDRPPPCPWRGCRPFAEDVANFILETLPLLARTDNMPDPTRWKPTTDTTIDFPGGHDDMPEKCPWRGCRPYADKVSKFVLEILPLLAKNNNMADPMRWKQGSNEK